MTTLLSRENSKFICAVSLLGCLLVAGPARAEDWPSYGRDAKRSASTEEKLTVPLRAVWEYTSAQAPRPSWPEPGVEMHRLDFDYTFHPIVAGGLVLFGSSADDAVRALDLSSGALRWQFTADGPVRFAPQVADGQCYVASDDGFVYCLSAATGELVWKFRAALNDRRVLGNGRMISRWPCRAGVLVDGGVVYVAAGMWPTEGIFLYALDARNGKPIWCNDTSGGMFMAYPHGGSLAIGGVAPQGYLLASADKLLVPTGRSVPAVFDRATGRFLYMRTAENRADGGWWATIAGDLFYGRTHGNKWKRAIRGEPFGPQDGDGMKPFSLASGDAGEPLPDREFVVGAGDCLFAAGSGAVEALQNGKAQWKVEHPRVYSLARAGNVLLVGGRGTISALRLEDGSLAWRGTVDGEARGIAVANGRLVVVTERGAITCFAPGTDGAGEKLIAVKPAVDGSEKEMAKAELPGVALDRLTGGYALILGDGNEPFTQMVLKQTGLHVIRVYTDRQKVVEARAKFLDRTALYGTRIAVQHIDDLAALPYPDFFANLVVVTGSVTGLSGAELYRVLRPCGGMMLFPGLPADAATALIRSADVPARETRSEGGRPMVVRGKLPGAWDWDSEVTSDERLKWPLELLWFGGPGPSRMPNRHGALLPVTANGRYFVAGRKDLIAVDAYNGCELWSKEIPDLLSKLGVLAADDDTVYVNFSDACLAIDAQTGVEKRTYRKEVKDTGTSKDGTWDERPPQARISRGLPVPAAGGQRTDPLSGKSTSMSYKRAYGCGSFISSATMHFFRSATFGIYDLKDDSGLRNFSGARPGCALSMIPSQGLLIANEGSGGCVCSYNFQTSFALAPARQARLEDWAVYFDNPGYEITRRAALNLGAPGDRRDENRLLWLGMPRPTTGLQLRCKMEIDPALGPNRINVDHIPIQGTHSPWIYGSAIYGLQRLTLDLEAFGNTVSLETARPPVMDGKLDDACWDGQFPLSVPDKKTVIAQTAVELPGSGDPQSGSGSGHDAPAAALSPAAPAPARLQRTAVFLRHDAKCLYLGYREPSMVDRQGKMTPWKSKLAGEDAPVWEDDSCEIAISNDRKEPCLHLGMSASGARYDGLWTGVDPYPVFDIPRLDHVEIDGKADDWSDRGFKVLGLADMEGNMRLPENFDPSFRLGWNEKGLLMLFHVRDNAVVDYSAQAAMWMKDSIELFMAENRDSQNRFHLCIGPGADGRQPKARAFFWDRRIQKGGAPLVADVKGARTPDGYLVEMLLPWSNLGITPTPGREVALQTMVNDADTVKGGANDWFRAVWHPDGHTEFKPKALHRLRLADQPGPTVQLERGGAPDKLGLVKSMAACAIPPVDTPRLDGITVDGKLDDWGERGFQQISMAAQDGSMRHPQNFDPSFRLGWNERGLLLAARIRDQTIVVDPDAERFWRKDSIEIFMTPKVGSKESIQLVLAPPEGVAPSQLRFQLQDNRGKAMAARGKPTVEVMGCRTKDGYLFEALIPWENLGIRPDPGTGFALQMFFNDADDTAPYPGDWFRTAWFPQGHAGWNPLAFHHVRLAAVPTKPVQFTRGERVNEDLVRAAEPFPWPMPSAQRGKAGEDSQWNGQWTGAVHADESAFACELAIPWETLERAGLKRDHLIVDFSRRGRIVEPPSWSFVPVDFRQTAASPARPYTVRLHFAELNEIGVGERVFDVKLQGKEVLTAFDVVKEAGGVRRALVKEFPHITASTQLLLELTPKNPKADWNTAPILNGLEVIAEE